MLNSGDILDETYVIDSVIGSGSLGVIYKAYHMRLQKYIILKRIRGDKVSYEKLRIEVDTLKCLHHAFLPQVYDFFYYNGDVYTIMDYIDGIDMKRLKESGYQFTQQQLIKWLRQLCSVLSYLHSREPQVIHSDIKPENIIVDSKGNVCLIDFNIAGVQGFTKQYASPEQYASVSLQAVHDPKALYYTVDGRSDIYSLGATFYYLISGVTPDVEWIDIPRLLDYKGLPYTRELTGIIDGMMIRDIHSRFQSADDILNVINGLKRTDSRYKLYFLLQGIASLIFISMLTFGVFLILNGHSLKESESFQAAYQSFVSCYDSGKYDEVQKRGNEILKKSAYKKYLTDDVKGKLFYTMANSYYEMKEYDKACNMYTETEKYIPTFDNKSEIFIDHSVALVQQGKIDEAVGVMKKAKENGATDTDLSFVNAQISFRNRDYAAAQQYIVNYLNNSSDSSKQAEMYVLSGQIYEYYGDYVTAADAYDRSYECKHNADSLRRYASVLNKYASGKSINDSKIIDLYKQCRDAYKKTYDNFKDEFDYYDYINYGNVCAVLQDYDTSIRILRELSEKYKTDFRPYFYLAKTYKMINDDVSAKENIALAMQYFGSGDKSDPDYPELERIYVQYYGNR